jgi:hypothetical protein
MEIDMDTQQGNPASVKLQNSSFFSLLKCPFAELYRKLLLGGRDLIGWYSSGAVLSRPKVI